MAGQVGGCVEQKVDVPVRKSVKQIVDDMSQIVVDTVAEQIVDVSVLGSPATEEFVDVIQPLPQDCIQGRQIVDFAKMPIKEELTEVSASGAHPRAHRGADSDIPRSADQGDNRGCVSGFCCRSASTSTVGSR